MTKKTSKRKRYLKTDAQVDQGQLSMYKRLMGV